MAGLALLSLVVGAAAAFRLPVVPFGALLVGVVLLGLLAGFVLVPSPGDVIAVALLLAACAQVGYGLGLALAGALRGRRRPPEPPPPNGGGC